jgi:hypothetical protein
MFTLFLVISFKREMTLQASLVEIGSRFPSQENYDGGLAQFKLDVSCHVGAVARERYSFTFVVAISASMR